jgi:hypothetical protein
LRHFSPEAECWQSQEIRKLAAEHGLKRFAGLDLHGIVGDRGSATERPNSTTEV